MPILDSDIIIAYFRNVPKAVEIIDKFVKEQKILKTTIFNVAELYKGAYLSSKVKENIKEIEEFLENVTIIDFTINDAIKFAKISAELRQKGEMIGDFDELIASVAINNNETIFTRNINHYERIPQLSFKNWEKT
ncbi:MAG: type II toxin-antitoxin system VapC family toxin [Promethearchaeota archaeon]|nr:MAG: type II toxin-antitoxin system VapC family toxin [Candidatus Lokiarchaeota archaeon]